MNEITIPYNDVFFYGLSMRSRDIADIRGDIFSNILMKYLSSLKPVTNRLYRTADDDRYEYSYSFVPTKPISWRVIKNRRIIEDVENLSDGKYCLSYYDDNGKDVKRVIFSNQHKWLKTNYYNSLYGAELLCSLVPKELNGQTVILQYVTGEAYPVTLHCCPVSANSEVMQSVLSRVPEPEVTALTNYGLLYFACEETLKLYTQVLSEEEKKYAEAHKPPVYNTEEDVAGGFCFDADSFDTTKSSDSIFDLRTVDELTENGFLDEFVDTDDSSEVAGDIAVLHSETQLDTDVDEEFSVDKQIAEAIRYISQATNINIDEKLVLIDDTVTQSESQTETVDVNTEEDVETEPETDVNNSFIVDVVDDIDDPDDIMDSAEDVEVLDDIVSNEISENEVKVIDVSDKYDAGIELLSMDDEAIDDYVSNLIDSIMMDAHTTAAEYLLDKRDEFVVENLNAETHIVDSDFISDNVADTIVESNGAKYFYYGELNENNQRHGRGKTLMADGKTAYEGDYSNDMRDGVGSFYFKDGNLCYWGDWKHNSRNGFGVGVSSETGITHIGHWENNKPTGIGVRFDKAGKFMYVDSACQNTNGGIRVTGFTENSVFVEVWDEKSLKVIKKEISVEDLLK